MNADDIRLMRRMSYLIEGRPCVIAMDRSSVLAVRAADNTPLRALAMDKSVRSYDYDGRLHISRANISKATVNPYIGNEIPDAERLGLEPQKIYFLYRDPEELQKAAATFNGLPLLSEHEPVTADTHDHDLVVGSTGTDAKFVYPFLTNSLVIWPEGDIEQVESDEKRQLSCGYRYTVDMTPGVSPEGDKYDGVMRDIVGNHVALVKEGRAGRDVVVGDSARKKGSHMRNLMTERAATTIRYLVPFVRAKLAHDQSIDLRRLLMGVSIATWNTDRPNILSGIQKLTRGKLAHDASIGEVAELLDMIEAHGGADGEDESVSKAQHNAMEAAAHGKSTLKIPKSVGKEYAEKDKGKSFDSDEGDGEKHKKLHEFLKDKVTAEDLETVHGIMSGHKEDEEEAGESEKFLGGKDEEGETPEEHLEDLGAADEESATEEIEAQEDRDDKKGENFQDPHAKGSRAVGRDRKRAKDEPPPFKGRPRPGGGMDRGHHAHDRALVTRAALDEAVSNAVADVTSKQKAIRDAERFVRPWVGEMSIAFDSAAKVYAHVLKTRGVDASGVTTIEGMKSLLKLVPQMNAAKPAKKDRQALDSKTGSSLLSTIPGLANIKVL